MKVRIKLFFFTSTTFLPPSSLAAILSPSIMTTFKDIVLKEADDRLATNKEAYDWVQQNTTWKNVKCSDSLLTVFGVDSIPVVDLKNYLEDKLSDVVVRGPSVLSESDVPKTIEDLLSSMKYSKECIKLIAFTSMETSAGGRLRATVAVVLSRKLPQQADVSCVVYKAIYDVSAIDNAVWHNSLGHLGKSKGWAIYKALTDFKANATELVAHMKDTRLAEIRTHTTQQQLLDSF